MERGYIRLIALDYTVKIILAAALGLGAYMLLTASKKLQLNVAAEIISPGDGGFVHFTATATGGKPPYFVDWSFGDGETVQNQWDYYHQYTYAGTYSITITLIDSNNVHDVKYLTVTV